MAPSIKSPGFISADGRPLAPDATFETAGLCPEAQLQVVAQPVAFAATEEACALYSAGKVVTWGQALAGWEQDLGSTDFSTFDDSRVVLGKLIGVVRVMLVYNGDGTICTLLWEVFLSLVIGRDGELRPRIAADDSTFICSIFIGYPLKIQSDSTIFSLKPSNVSVFSGLECQQPAAWQAETARLFSRSSVASSRLGPRAMRSVPFWQMAGTLGSIHWNSCLDLYKYTTSVVETTDCPVGDGKSQEAMGIHIHYEMLSQGATNSLSFPIT